MKKLIVFNHKMSLLYDDLYNYIEMTNNIEMDNDLIICPSNIYLEAFINNSEWSIGTQNLHYDLEPNYTGEVSTNQLKNLGVEYALIGHHDRVVYFHESPKVVNSKLLAALDSNIFPILCFGENIDEDYKEVIPKILDSYLKEVENIEFIIFAYEPVYAVGTGINLNINKIKEVTSFINKYLEDKYKKKPVLLYGGSVDSTNIKEIMSLEDINGVVVGSISSDINEVNKIIKNV